MQSEISMTQRAKPRQFVLAIKQNSVEVSSTLSVIAQFKDILSGDTAYPFYMLS